VKCVISLLAPYASFSLQRGCLLPLCDHEFLLLVVQLTCGTAGCVGFLEGVKNAVTGFNNVLNLMQSAYVGSDIQVISVIKFYHYHDVRVPRP
jgi:hypothetical protein